MPSPAPRLEPLKPGQQPASWDTTGLAVTPEPPPAREWERPAPRRELTRSDVEPVWSYAIVLGGAVLALVALCNVALYAGRHLLGCAL